MSVRERERAIETFWGSLSSHVPRRLHCGTYLALRLIDGEDSMMKADYDAIQCTSLSAIGCYGIEPRNRDSGQRDDTPQRSLVFAVFEFYCALY